MSNKANKGRASSLEGKAFAIIIKTCKVVKYFNSRGMIQYKENGVKLKSELIIEPLVNGGSPER